MTRHGTGSLLCGLPSLYLMHSIPDSGSDRPVHCESQLIAKQDILVDWNLWPRLILGKDKHTKDAYARWTYAPAAAANSLLRFSWLIYLSPVPSDALKSFINAMFEALRRLLWNLYRLEAEQLGK
jgi:hypothetical protein